MMIAALFTIATNLDPNTSLRANPGAFVEQLDSLVKESNMREVTPRQKIVRLIRNQSRNLSRRKDRLSDTLLDTHLSRKSLVRRREKPLRQNLLTNQ